MINKTFEITCAMFNTVKTVKVTHASTKVMFGKEYNVYNYTILASEHKQAVGKTGTIMEIDLPKMTKMNLIKEVA